MRKLILTGLAIFAAFIIVEIAAAASANPLNAINAKLDAIQAQLNTISNQVGALTPAPAATTRLLFPFVTNQAGFDTGVVITNASNTLDPPGVGGTCTIYYFGSTSGGGAAPAPQTTGVIPAGGQNVFTLSSGGFDMNATLDFQGFIVANCNFPRARGWGLFSDVGATDIGASIVAEVIP